MISIVQNWRIRGTIISRRCSPGKGAQRWCRLLPRSCPPSTTWWQSPTTHCKLLRCCVTHSTGLLSLSLAAASGTTRCRQSPRLLSCLSGTEWTLYKETSTSNLRNWNYTNLGCYLVPETSRHSKSRSLLIFQPYSQRPHLLPILITIRIYTTLWSDDSRSLVRILWFVVDREGCSSPSTMRLHTAQHCFRVSQVTAIKFTVIQVNTNWSRSRHP